MPSASACGSPGGTSQAFSPWRSTSRIAGKSEATIGTPDAMYSNSFSGEVSRAENSVRVHGMVTRSHAPIQSGTVENDT